MLLIGILLEALLDSAYRIFYSLNFIIWKSLLLMEKKYWNGTFSA